MSTYKPVVGDIVRIYCYAAAAGQIGIFGVSHRITAVITGGATLSEIATARTTIMKPLVRPLLSSNSSYLGVKAAVLNRSPTPAPGIAADVAFGTGGAALLPTQTSGLISLRTEVAGRRGRGRAYIPFPATFSSDGNNYPIPAYTNDLATLAEDLVSPHTTVGAGGAVTLIPVVTGRTFTPAFDLDDYVIQARWATQRRRGQWGKQNPAIIS